MLFFQDRSVIIAKYDLISVFSYSGNKQSLIIRIDFEPLFKGCTFMKRKTVHVQDTYINDVILTKIK